MLLHFFKRFISHSGFFGLSSFLERILLALFRTQLVVSGLRAGYLNKRPVSPTEISDSCCAVAREPGNQYRQEEVKRNDSFCGSYKRAEIVQSEQKGNNHNQIRHKNHKYANQQF